jgi:hypothetical protein
MRHRDAASSEHLIVLGGYTLLTLLLTYPIPLQLSTHVPGDGGDTHIFVWNLWWMKKALTDLRANPFWTDYLFYPEGASLILHVLAPLRGLLGIPLQSVAGLVGAHNLMILLSFVLSGFGAYRLILYLLADRPSAFIGGAIFAFCPYKFAHLLGHHDLIGTEWLPFYALALLKLTSASGRGMGPTLLCALLLLLIAITSYYYLFYAFILTLVLVTYRSWTPGRQTFWDRDCRRLATALALFMFGFAPLLALGGPDLLSPGLGTAGGWGGATGFQADILAFITPSPLHPLLGPLVQPITGQFKGGIAEATIFAGYVPLALGLIAAVTLRHTEPWVRFWTVCLVVFFLLSLGPFPRILGRGIRLIALPYQLIMRAPILTHFRVPSRLDIMVMLSLAVLAAFACHRLRGRFTSGAGRSLFSLGVVLTVAFEYLAIPFPTFKPSVPKIYRQIAREPETFTVLEIPVGWRDGIRRVGIFPSSQLYHQTVHGKRIVGGYIARVPNRTIEALAARPLLKHFLELQDGHLTAGGGTRDQTLLLLDDLKALQVRYVILHAPFNRSPVRDYVEGALPVETVAEEVDWVAYRVTGYDIRTPEVSGLRRVDGMASDVANSAGCTHRGVARCDRG